MSEAESKAHAITQILREWSEGRQGALDKLMPRSFMTNCIGKPRGICAANAATTRFNLPH